MQLTAVLSTSHREALGPMISFSDQYALLGGARMAPSLRRLAILVVNSNVWDHFSSTSCRCCCPQHCRWDALASFNDTASTILPEASLPRQPSTASNNKNVNTVWMFTLLRVTEWFLPAAVPGINATMTKYGLDTSYVTPDKSTMAGIGNFVGSLWVQHGLQVCHNAVINCSNLVLPQ